MPRSFVSLYYDHEAALSRLLVMLRSREITGRRIGSEGGSLTGTAKRAPVAAVSARLVAAPRRRRAIARRLPAGPMVVAAAWCLMAALLVAWVAPSPPALREVAAPWTKPEKGRFLVAARQILDPGFAQSVVLLVAYDQEGGAMGIIVNQPMPLKLATVLPDVRPLARRSDRLWRGGPVLPASLLVLVRSTKPVEGSDVVFEDVRVLTSRDAFRHALDGQVPRTRLRAFAGHAGWGPGQLEAEIARGDWIVMPAKAEQVFSEKPEEVWPGLVEHGEGQWTLLHDPRPAS
jgi:putative transcriptional regulator